MRLYAPFARHDNQCRAKVVRAAKDIVIMSKRLEAINEI
jgi:hypothetical protein